MLYSSHFIIFPGECGSNPCQHSGACSASGGAFTCDCSDTGYTGTLCETGKKKPNNY